MTEKVFAVRGQEESLKCTNTACSGGYDNDDGCNNKQNNNNNNGVNIVPQNTYDQLLHMNHSLKNGRLVLSILESVEGLNPVRFIGVKAHASQAYALLSGVTVLLVAIYQFVNNRSVSL